MMHLKSDVRAFLASLFLAALGLVAAGRPPLVVASRGYSSWWGAASHCGAFSSCGPWALGHGLQ